MPRIVDVTHLEDCLESTVLRQLTLDVELDEPIMRRLATSARLQYFPKFPRPYFRIERSGHYVIQGILGNTTFRVTAKLSSWEETEIELSKLVEETELEGEGTKSDD